MRFDRYIIGTTLEHDTAVSNFPMKILVDFTARERLLAVYDNVKDATPVFVLWIADFLTCDPESSFS